MEKMRLSEANIILKKSSLVLRFVNNDFQENKEPTIGGTYIFALILVALYEHTSSIVVRYLPFS